MTTDKPRRTVFFVSDRTGITAELLGKTLLTQFPGFDFQKRTFPFIDTVDKARATLAKIEPTAGIEGHKPIVFSTLIGQDLRESFTSDHAVFIDLFTDFLRRLEVELGVKASGAPGLSHGRGNELVYQKRMDALNYTLAHDDGVQTTNYDRAEVILVGVSRTGKTPTCLYLAMQYGICAANFPLTPDDLTSPGLPKPLIPHREKLYGLTISPERLSKIRHERKPDSRYAALENCQHEIRGAETLLRQAHVPLLDTTSMSVEEIAISILHGTGLAKRHKI